MKKISFLAILCLFGAGMISQAGAQSEDFEKTGQKHFENAFFKATLQKDRARADEEFAMAEKAFQRAIANKPHRIDAYLHLGRTYHVQKKYAAAAGIYRSALAIAPHEEKIYLRLASALEKAGDYRGALNTLEQLRFRLSDERAIRILDGFINEMERRDARRNN